MNIILVSLLLLLTSSSETYLLRTKKVSDNHNEFLAYASKFETDFTREYKQFRKTGIQTEKYEDLIEAIKPPNNLLRRNEVEEMSDQKFDVTCMLCRAVVNTVLNYRREEGYDDEQMIEQAIDLCISLNIQPENVCEQLISIQAVPVMYIADRRPDVTAKDVCGILLQGSNCAVIHPRLDYSIDVDENESFEIQDKFDNKEENFRILHITDIHYDPKYVPGANAECEEPVCCRDAELDLPEDAAGHWGDYRNCDAPWHAIVDAMKHINETHNKFDWIYYTGDIIDHAVWETSVDGNIETMNVVFRLLKETFPDTPLFPILGNHEAHPVNVFAPHNITDETLTTNWLYDYAAETWSDWLPADTVPTIKRGGYYTTLIKPGIRLIALNNNECYVNNWWTFYATYSQEEQLRWLHDVLLRAEADDEYVHILSHIYAGDISCYSVWSREYRRIVERFTHIIRGQFYGHTHFDEFNIFYKMDDPSTPINVGWNGGSISAYADVNPNYVIYHVGKNSLNVNEYESWSYNLTEANLTPTKRPNWYKMYSFREEFNLPDLSVQSLDDLMHQFTIDEILLRKYWQYKVKKADPFVESGCQKMCLLNTLCEIVTNETGDNQKCEYFMELMNINNVTNV